MNQPESKQAKGKGGSARVRINQGAKWERSHEAKYPPKCQKKSIYCRLNLISDLQTSLMLQKKIKPKIS